MPFLRQNQGPYHKGTRKHINTNLKNALVIEQYRASVNWQAQKTQGDAKLKQKHRNNTPAKSTTTSIITMFMILSYIYVSYIHSSIKQ